MVQTAERWWRLEELFRKGADLPAGEQPAFLDGTCGADPLLRRELALLLEADPDAEGFLEAAVAAGLAAGVADPIAEAAPGDGGERRIGPYRLLREIGRGGTSRVFLAERAGGDSHRRVAIKLLRPGMDSDEILRRFSVERRILARLDHPNIARLFDGGTTGDGRPYFVMEAIEGLPIDRYAAERRLGLGDRLRLFLAVCRAVHYAHQNLVVHRDLKPSNVLVTSEGQPKLLDFGIAKLLDPDLTQEATRTALRPMTPGYASPEQVRGEAVTTASDVYSLGVLLYRLLCGRHPYPLEGALPGELERRIAEEEPPAPSAVATSLSERRSLAGDLDDIVATAMAKDPARRYASAEQLALDVRRHLDGLPVSARPPTFGYRASRFLARYRLPVAAAAVFALLLVVFAASTAVQSARIAEERDRAERVSAVLVELFEVTDPGSGGSVTAREILDRGAARVQEELIGSPELRSTVLETIARAYRNLGLYDSAEPLLAEVLELRRWRAGAGDPQLASTLDQLGVVRALRGDYASAEPLLAEALAIRETELGPSHPETAKSLNNLALVRHDRGDYAGAEPLYQRALALERGPDGSPEPITLSNLALLLYDLGRYQQAEERYREVLAIQRWRLGEDDQGLATALGQLGLVLRARGRHAEAEPLLRRALELASSGRDEGHPELARALHDLGLLLTDLGLLLTDLRRTEEAERLLRRALAVREAALGPRHPETAASREALARLLAVRGDAEKARALYADAVASFRAALPPGHPSIGQALLGLGELLVSRGECRAAEPALAEAREIAGSAAGPGDWRVAAAGSLLGVCLAERGRPLEAGRLLAESARRLEDALGPEHPETRRARERLAALRARG